MSSFAKNISFLCEDSIVILLNGDLGVGKTFFTKYLIAVLCNVNVNNVDSPTFSICHEYKSTKNKKILHYDLYRIKDKSEIYEIGVFENFEKALIIIEWPDLISKYILESSIKYININIAINDTQERFIEVKSNFTYQVNPL